MAEGITPPDTLGRSSTSCTAGRTAAPRNATWQHNGELQNWDEQRGGQGGYWHCGGATEHDVWQHHEELQHGSDTTRERDGPGGE